MKNFYFQLPPIAINATYCLHHIFLWMTLKRTTTTIKVIYKKSRAKSSIVCDDDDEKKFFCYQRAQRLLLVLSTSLLDAIIAKFARFAYIQYHRKRWCIKNRLRWHARMCVDHGYSRNDICFFHSMIYLPSSPVIHCIHVFVHIQ